MTKTRRRRTTASLDLRNNLSGETAALATRSSSPTGLGPISSVTLIGRNGRNNSLRSEASEIGSKDKILEIGAWNLFKKTIDKGLSIEIHSKGKGRRPKGSTDLEEAPWKATS